jgi:hypothetical protein
VRGFVSPEQYMRLGFRQIGKIESFQIIEAHTASAEAPFDESVAFMIHYEHAGREFYGVVTTTVAHSHDEDGKTYGFCRMVLATPEKLADNSQKLTELLETVKPAPRGKQ